MKNKNPLLAGLLNIVFPGLGAAYIGEWDHMVPEFLLVVPFVVIWLFGSFLVGLIDNHQRLMYFNAGFAFLYGLAMFLNGRQAALIHNQKTQAM